MELKYTVNEMKNEIDSTVDSEETICKLKHRSFEIIKSEEQNENGIKWKKPKELM